MNENGNENGNENKSENENEDALKILQMFQRSGFCATNKKCYGKNCRQQFLLFLHEVHDISLCGPGFSSSNIKTYFIQSSISVYLLPTQVLTRCLWSFQND